MSSIYSENARFSVQAVNDEPGDDPSQAAVLISSYVLMGEHYQTKIGADFKLPPEKAIELGKQILKCAYQLTPVEAA